ncbi:hypothetical protein F5Y17DRAFT_1157 [Xylariaceae sp. FL0594]|nr:hypothetical protein F5Y17DRAFT_1157 [Xylariaceae sp. FL0594]
MLCGVNFVKAPCLPPCLFSKVILTMELNMESTVSSRSFPHFLNFVYTLYVLLYSLKRKTEVSIRRKTRYHIMFPLITSIKAMALAQAKTLHKSTGQRESESSRGAEDDRSPRTTQGHNANTWGHLVGGNEETGDEGKKGMEAQIGRASAVQLYFSHLQKERDRQKKGQGKG